jgi:ferritin-like protein
VSDYHEPEAELSAQARNIHRALTSLKEEFEAIDWYHQRWDACRDESLRAVIAHNRDDEIEHACMLLEWIRKNMPHWDENMRKYLFTEGAAPQAVPADLGLGSLRRRA